jgi:hypothetical protein
VRQASGNNEGREDGINGNAASFDSLWVMEQVMAHFFRRAMVEQRMGAQAN